MSFFHIICKCHQILWQSEKDELKRKCLQLEKDLQSATDAGLELNEMLSDFLTSQKENVDLNSRIKELCRVISKQQEAINELEKTSNELKQEVSLTLFCLNSYFS